MLGGWAFFMPGAFYDNFPIAGADWVSTLGELNEHLMTDFGATQLGLGVAALIAAGKDSRTGIVSVMIGFVVFGILHLGYHFTTFDHFTTGSALAQAIALATFILLPLGILQSLRGASSAT